MKKRKANQDERHPGDEPKKHWPEPAVPEKLVQVELQRYFQNLERDDSVCLWRMMSLPEYPSTGDDVDIGFRPKGSSNRIIQIEMFVWREGGYPMVRLEEFQCYSASELKGTLKEFIAHGWLKVKRK